jgi:hypothetical protein
MTLACACSVGAGTLVAQDAAKGKKPQKREPLVLAEQGSFFVGGSIQFTTFARRGFSPYVVDAPNRGRSGYDPTHRYKAILGLEPASALEVGNIYSAHSAWVAFRFGATYGVQYPGQQFPIEHLNDYVMQLVPSYRDAAQIR